MAKATTMKRQGRRLIPATRTAQAKTRKVKLTLGDLIAAAFDSVGNEARAVAQVLISQDMTLATGRKIVLV